MARKSVAPADGTFVNMLIAVVAMAALVYIVYVYTHSKKPVPVKEGMYAGGFDAGSGIATVGTPIPADPASTDHRTVDYPSAPGGDGALAPNDCFPKDRLVATDLLPKDAANEQWARINPAGQGDVDDKNFLNAGYHAGLNTLGASRRNANMGLRSEPPNPRATVSVWNQSTIEPDLNRRPLEIGRC